MTVLEISGKKVQVDDSFLKLSPEDQQKTVNEIAGQIGITAMPQEEQPATLQDMGQSALAGIRSGIETTAGMMGDMGETNASVASWLAGKLGAGEDTQNIVGSVARRISPFPTMPSTDEIRTQATNPVMGEGYQPKTVPGEYAKTVGEFLPGAALGKGNLAKRVVTQAVLPAVTSETAGQLTKGSEYEPYARVAGAIAGNLVPSGVGALKTAVTAKPKLPDLTELKTQAKAAYDAADNAGVMIKPEWSKKLATDIKTELADFGYDPELQPRLAVVLKRLETAGEDNITLKGVDVIRRIADNARKSIDPSEKALGNIVITKIDDYVENLNQQDILTGDLKGAAKLKEARKIWSRVAKNERVIDAIESATDRAGSTGSGGNVENATRQNLRKELSKGRGWTADEKDALRGVVRGTKTQNALRLAGKLSPNGNGLMAALGIGGTMANPLLGIPMIAGVGAKYAADKGVQASVEELQALIRAGGNKEVLNELIKQARRDALAAKNVSPGELIRQGAVSGLLAQSPENRR